MLFYKFSKKCKNARCVVSKLNVGYMPAILLKKALHHRTNCSEFHGFFKPVISRPSLADSFCYCIKINKSDRGNYPPT